MGDKMNEAMDEIERLRTFLKSVRDEYKALNKIAEAQAVSRRWASGSYINLEPFYFEYNRFFKGKILKAKPKKIANAYEYGFDAQDRVVFERQHDGKKHFFESLYFWGRDEVLKYHFGCYNKRCVGCFNIKRFIYENGELKFIYSAFDNNAYGIENFTYEGGKLAQRREYVEHPRAGRRNDVTNYEFDAMGELSLITENGYVRYQKPDKNMSYKKLYELAAQRLLPAIKETIKKHAPGCKLYCINLAYDDTGSLPPQIGFGSQEQRAQWLAQGDDDNWIVWNVADYEFQAELDEDDETANLFDLFNQETRLNGRYPQAKKLILECAKQLKADISELGLDVSEDFALVASDYDLSDLRKNFKAINPELASAYKGKI